MTTTHDHEVTIRLAGERDALALGRLAQLDSGLYPGGPALVAEIGGRAVAALPLDGSPPFADPFVRTAQLTAMLELRARQLSAAAGRGSPAGATGVSRALRAVRRRRRYRAPASA